MRSKNAEAGLSALNESSAGLRARHSGMGIAQCRGSPWQIGVVANRLYGRLAERAGTHGVANWAELRVAQGSLNSFCLASDESSAVVDDGSIA